MTDATAKRLAWGLFTLCCLFYLADILVPPVARAQAGRSIGAGVGLVELALVAMSFSFPVAGIMIARRQPGSRISWLLLTIGLVFGVPTDPYIKYGLRLHPGALPGADLVAALAAAGWAPALGLVATFPVLLFPDGHLPSPRWRWVGWFSGLSIAWVYLLITVMPGKLEVGGAPAFDKPLGIDAPGPLPGALLPTIVVLTLSFLMCAMGLVRRFRRSRGVERLQLSGSPAQVRSWLCSTSSRCFPAWSAASRALGRVTPPGCCVCRTWQCCPSR